MRRLPVVLAALAAAMSASPASAKRPMPATPLSSTVARLDLDPTVVVAPADAGTTPLERYRATRHPGPYPASTPLVLLVRGGTLNSPDTLAITRAERRGHLVTVELERRRFTGPLSANDVTQPLVEVELGPLGAGDWQIDVRETELTFDKYDHPEAPASPRPGLTAQLRLSVK
jgi:hypothetical protein